MIIYLEQNITHLRVKKGISKTALSELLGLGSSVTVGDYETGKSRPSFDRLLKLSEIFETDLNTLVFVNLESGEAPGVKYPAPEYKIDLKEDLCRLWNRLEELEGRVGKLEGDG